jgi:S1-C subfamily serine protease
VEFAGIILDSSGDVLLPLYIAPDTPMQVTVDDETATTASVVASDELTALSVVKLARPAGEAAAFADAKPADGSLMLVLAPTRRLARLTVWTGTADDNAILVDSAGKFSAIVRNGHALFPSTYLPVVNQLRSGGQVKRAQLGVMIYEVGVDDPIRTKLAALGSRPAARIMQIVPGSAADKGGLQAGDLILQLNDERVEDVATFAAIIANCRGTTTLHILRGETAQTIAVDLQPQ